MDFTWSHKQRPTHSNTAWSPIITYPDWPPKQGELPLWQAYHATPAVLFDFHVYTYLTERRQQPKEEITLVKHQEFDKDRKMFVYPDYPGQLSYHRYSRFKEMNFHFLTLRPPRHDETPMYPRIDDGSAWVRRNLHFEEEFWQHYGINHLPIGDTEAALSQLTIVGEPGELITHYLDYHPLYPRDVIAVPVVDHMGQLIQQKIIDLCTAHADNRKMNHTAAEERQKRKFLSLKPYDYEHKDHKHKDYVWQTP